jgi:hypothetical protein
MQIKTIDIQSQSYNKIIPFEKVNYLSKLDFLLSISALSSYTGKIGAKKENKDLKIVLTEDTLTNIEIERHNIPYKWGRKYYVNTETYSELQTKDLKKLSAVHVYSNDKDYFPSFYYISRKPLSYKDGDFTKSHILMSIYELFSEREFYLNQYIIHKYSAIQNGKEDSDLHLKYLKYIENFKLKEHNIADVNYDFIEEKSGNQSLYNIYLEYSFYIIDNKESKFKFVELNTDDLEFLLLLNEIYFRLYLISIYSRKEEVQEKITEIQGILVLCYKIDDFYLNQLNNIFKNIQIIIQN